MLSVHPDSRQIAHARPCSVTCSGDVYPSQADNERNPKCYPLATWCWLAILVAVAAIPRLLLAARAEPICDDGFFYLSVADALERGAYKTALWYLNVNVFPVILVALNSLGLVVLPAAKFWSAIVGTLTVFPLFGWLRRILGQKVALAACFVYAMHPEFIEIAAEPIRDSTFWFLMALALYFCRRAADDRRLLHFASAGLVVALAAHTRTEGWLLVLPMVFWPMICATQDRTSGEPRRDRNGHGSRRAGPSKTVLGILLSLAMIPAFLVVYNVTILRGHRQWEFGKLEHFQMVMVWLIGSDSDEFLLHDEEEVEKLETVENENRAKESPTPRTRFASNTQVGEMFAELQQERRESGPPPGIWDHVSLYIDAMIQSLKPIPLILMLIGAIAGRRFLLEPENLLLSAMFVAIGLAIWIRLATLGDINARYFLSCFFPAAGSVGLGVVAVLDWLEHVSERFVNRPVAARMACGLLLLIGLLHSSDAVLGQHPSRLREARIGRMLGEELEGEHRFITLPHAARVGYYADGELPVMVLDNTPISKLIDQSQADVAILEHELTSVRHCANLAARLIASGWKPHDITHIPESEHFLVFVKSTERTPSPRPTKTASVVRPNSPQSR